MFSAALDQRVLPGHTSGMKCAISLPDELFDEVGRQAEKLGISRSQFFATAAARYVDDLAHDDRVDAIDAVVEEHGEAIDREMAWLHDVGRRSLAHVEWSADDPS
jgi:metal-responsive CopG/Arc/MetJ family transcriptional regulator